MKVFVLRAVQFRGYSIRWELKSVPLPLMFLSQSLAYVCELGNWHKNVNYLILNCMV